MVLSIHVPGIKENNYVVFVMNNFNIHVVFMSELGSELRVLPEL